MKDKIAEILKEYTKKKGISASFVILEAYAEELVANGCVAIPFNDAKQGERCGIMPRYVDREKFMKNLETDKYGFTDSVKVGIALDKAAVELEQEYDILYKKNLQLKSDIERLQKLLDENCDMCIERERSKAKDKAIKEVLQRATEIFLDAKYIADDTHYARGCNAVIDYCINELHQIAKEMGCDTDV